MLARHLPNGLAVRIRNHAVDGNVDGGLLSFDASLEDFLSRVRLSLLSLRLRTDFSPAACHSRSQNLPHALQALAHIHKKTQLNMNVRMHKINLAEAIIAGQRGRGFGELEEQPSSAVPLDDDDLATLSVSSTLSDCPPADLIGYPFPLNAGRRGCVPSLEWLSLPPLSHALPS